VPVFEKRRLKDIERFTRSKLIQATVPTTEEILARRQVELSKQLTVWLARGRCKTERAIVEKLVAEQGIDPLEIAAVALKIARGDEKQRPIAPMTELNEVRPARPMRGSAPRRESGEARSYAEKRSSSGEKRSSSSERPAYVKSREVFPGAKFGGSSHEPGMVRLTMSMGKMHGIRPSDVVGAIAYHADIPGNTIGKIYIEDQHTLVDVPEQFVGQVLAKAGKYSIRKQAFTVEKA